MTILKTIHAIAQSAIELPNAIHACVEMARESSAYAREQSPEKRALADMSMVAAANEKKIARLENELTDLSVLYLSATADLNAQGPALTQCKTDLQIARELATKHIVEAQDNFDKLRMVAEELNAWHDWAVELWGLRGDASNDDLRLTGTALVNGAEVVSRERFDKLAAQESELARLREFARWHNRSEQPGLVGRVLVVSRTVFDHQCMSHCFYDLLSDGCEWRYARLEDVP
jgi:hypothetical protein